MGVYTLAELTSIKKELSNLLPADARDRLVRGRLSTTIQRKAESVQLNRFRQKVFLTDAQSVRGSGRVYPYVDEAELLVNYIEMHGYHTAADVIVDLCCGCGHVIIGCPAEVTGVLRFGLDINPRALQFAEINALINESSAVFQLGDIRCGIPAAFHRLQVKNFLFSANMPFGLDPSAFLPISTSSDERGTRLTLATLKGLKDFTEHLVPGRTGRAVVLAYSLQSQAIYDVVEHAYAIFGPERVRWNLLEHERVWRVNGVKQCRNPMPLDNLTLKAESRYDVDEARREEARASYAALVQRLRAHGYTHLSMGILDIRL
ncbi:MAG: hypothetical protein LAQ69_17920 [Acidobacteriia bacterium]|nr:hypothetical protein [Terriglobia bacterium]